MFNAFNDVHELHIEDIISERSEPVTVAFNRDMPYVYVVCMYVYVRQ